MVGSEGTAGKSFVNVEIRNAIISDAAAIADIFYHTVMNVNVRDYSRAQVEAWAGPAPEPGMWERRITAGESRTFVATHGGRIVGFAEFEGDGHIDTLYVHHEYQACGIASRLLDRIEAEAQRLGLARLFTEASITARPFFRKRGFSVVTPQTVEVRGQTFRNYRMEKTRHTRGSDENA